MIGGKVPVMEGGKIMTGIANLDKLCLEKLLRELYTAQQCSFFMEDAMDKIINRFSLSEEQAIELTKLLMEKKLISTKSFLPATFLRPRNIHRFPIVLSAKAINLLKESSADSK
jgi:carbamate kinase